MNISEICIKRPVLATVLSLIIIVFGLMGYSHLETRYFPNVNSYTIIINTTYAGASAKLIETTVNSQIEDAISGVGGIDSLTSSANQGMGTVTINFKAGVDFSEKANEVRDKVASIRGLLPAGIDAPQVVIGNNTDMLLDIAFTNSKMTPVQIREYVNRYIKDTLQQIPGVGLVALNGSSDYAMRIWLDPAKMAARGITVADVRNALQTNNVQLPAGEFKSTTMNFPVTEDTQLKSAAEFNNLTIADRQGNIVRISDIGRAELGLVSDPINIRLDAEPAIDASIFLETGANPIAVSQAIYKTIKEIKPSLPLGMQMKVSFDIANFLQESVHEVYLAIFFAILCVLGVIFLFLGTLRSVLIPVVTIPICVIGVFGLIALLGYSINILTLLAIVLAIGLVVDDAVVVLENIYRHIEEGKPPVEAAIIGSKEITFAVIAMTLTLLAVYAPVGFLSDRAALVLREFAFTLAGAVLISGFVALTLSPSMCALLLKQSHSKYTLKIDQVFSYLKQRYLYLLDLMLAHRARILIIGLILAVIGGFLFKVLPKEFAPDEDMGIVVGNLKTPTGSNIDYTYQYILQVENIFKPVPERFSLFSAAGFGAPETGQLFLFLKPQQQRDRSSKQIGDELNKKVQQIPGITASAFALAPFSSLINHGLQVQIMTSESYESLNQTMQTILNNLKKYPGLVNIQSSVKFDSQQYNIVINRDLANNLAITTRDIDETVATLLGGSYSTDFYMGNKSYRVMVQANAENITQPADIAKFYVRAGSGALISLDNLVTVTPVLEQPTLEHYNRLRSAMLTADLAPGYNLSQVINYLDKNLPGWLNSNTKYTYAGQAKDMNETSNSAGVIFILALVFIYLVLAAQFESFMDPLVILLTVPLSLVGALVVLWIVGGSINLYTAIGLITLVGLVTKHGILIVQFANELQSQGLSVADAVRQAATTRLRPILMTTGAMVLGAMPLALAVGTGAVSRSQIGWVIVGGLLFGTFFSLGVVPVTYSYFAKFK